MYERASRSVSTFTAPKTFIRSSATLRTRKVVLSGALFVAASVLGIVTLGTAAAAAKPGNVGNGTFALNESAPLGPRTKPGIYTLRCIAAAANGGTFRLEDPDGIVLGDVAIAGGAGGTAVVGEHIRGTITDGATDFAVGDGFDVTVGLAPKVAGLDRAKLAAAASVDGSQEPSLVLAYDVDASAGDVEAIAYESGDFVREQLVFGAGITADTARESLRRRNITLG
ncbi:head decoration protein [Sphingomonas sp. RHCKR47]|uniref:head decoration protein n=1 Tax=Sphingomonas citricola TaxID=2862498 RepID=UPI001C66FED1|nr:head decoration protein [Sphingomonas citricola]MBW6524427.1 head decoration protein [Sphingomonas citricola]